jgi:DNA polymerase-3 subunit delta
VSPPGRRAGAAPSAPADLPVAPVVLVTGSEGLLADRAIASFTRAVRAEDPDAAVELIDAAGYTEGRLEQLAGPSLFGGGTLIVASGIEAAADAFVSEARSYLSTPAPGAWLVLRHAGGNRAKPLLDAARKAGAPEAVCAPITRDEDKVEFATGEFRRLGRRASPQAVRALVDAVGSDLRELAAACQQLADDTPGSTTGTGGEGRIEADVIESWFGGRVEVTGFRVADAAVAGRADQALSLLRHALATGADPVPLVAAIAAKVRAMAKVSVAGRGRSADLAAALGMPGWQIDRARRDLGGWNEAGLATAITALAEADTAVKGGGRDPVYAVERAVLTIAAARRG